MTLPGPHLPQLVLRPGELVVTRESRWVITLLGSCVAVTMFNARLHLAAICHGMLPGPRNEECPAAGQPQQFRYLSCVIPEMAGRFQMAGIDVSEIEVKMFGGGNVINLGAESHQKQWIGTANVTAARSLLQAARLTVRSENVGGSCGRKIVFNTHSGLVLHKHLSRSEQIKVGNKWAGPLPREMTGACNAACLHDH
jgi:chemotaxis protein CheD